MTPESVSYLVLAVVADVALAGAALGAVVFVVLYHLWADWRASDLGRNMMAFMFVCAVLLTLGVVRAIVLPPDHALEAFRVIAYSLVCAIIWHRVFLLIRYQRPRRRPDRDRERDDEDTPEKGIKVQ